MPSLEEQGQTLRVINAEISDRLTRQAASGSQVDTKAALLAGFAATAAQFLAGREPMPNPTFATAAYVFYSVAFVAAITTYAVARHEDVPEPRELVRGCAHRTEAYTLARLVATRVKAFEKNQRTHRLKVVRWWVSVAALTVGLVLSTVALVC